MTTEKITGFMKTLLVSCLSAVLLFLLFGWILYLLKGSKEMAGYLVLAIHGVSCLIGGYLNGKRMGRQRLFWGLMIGSAYLAVLFLLRWTFGSGAMEGTAGTRQILVSLIGAIAGSILS